MCVWVSVAVAGISLSTFVCVRLSADPSACMYMCVSVPLDSWALKLNAKIFSILLSAPRHSKGRKRVKSSGSS